MLNQLPFLAGWEAFWLAHFARHPIKVYAIESGVILSYERIGGLEIEGSAS